MLYLYVTEILYCKMRRISTFIFLRARKECFSMKKYNVGIIGATGMVELDEKIRDKKERYFRLSQRSLNYIKNVVVFD